MLKSKRNLVLTGVVAIALCLAGCGNRTPANAPLDDSSSSGSTAPAPDASASPAAPAAPAAPAVPQTPAYTQPVTGSLVVSNVTKTKKGFIFKTLTVAGSVVNSSNVPLSGTLKIEFKKNKGIFSKTLVTTDTKTQAITTLQPGQSFPFTVTADHHGDDDAEVTVDTNPAAPAAAPAAPAAAAAAAPAGGAAMMTMPGYGYPAPSTGQPY